MGTEDNKPYDLPKSRPYDEGEAILIEEAIEAYRAGNLNIDNIIRKYDGNDSRGFVGDLVAALAIEEIFREFSGRAIPKTPEKEKEILEISRRVKKSVLENISSDKSLD